MRWMLLKKLEKEILEVSGECEEAVRRIIPAVAAVKDPVEGLKRAENGTTGF